MTTVGILRAARERISDPRKWCDVGWGSGEKACAIHALTVVAHGVSFPPIAAAHPAFMALTRAINGCYIGSFNDSHTHAEVLAAFDRAIQNEEAKEAEFVITDEFVQAIKETVNV